MVDIASAVTGTVLYTGRPMRVSGTYSTCPIQIFMQPVTVRNIPWEHSSVFTDDV